MTLDRIQLWEADGIDPSGGNYTKHWSFEWPDLNSYGPVPSDGTALELDFAAEFPDGSGNAAGFYLGVSDPTRFHYLLDGDTFDSASPPAWYSETAGDYSGSYGTVASAWTASGGGLQLEIYYNGTSGWTLLADTAEPISADTASDPDWWHTAPPPAGPTITSILPGQGILGETATISGTNLSTVTDVSLPLGLSLASWTIVSDTQIDLVLSAVASADAVSAATVSVSNSVGDVATYNWTVLFPGTWETFDPQLGPWISLGGGNYAYSEIRTDQGEEPLSARPWLAGGNDDLYGLAASHYYMDNSPTVSSSAPRFNAGQSLRLAGVDLDHAVTVYPDEVMPVVAFDPFWVDTGTPLPDDAEPAGAVPIRVEYETTHSTFNEQVQYKRPALTDIRLRSDGSPDITAKESDPVFTQTWTERLVPASGASIVLTDSDGVTTALDRRHDQVHLDPDVWPVATDLAALTVIASHPPTSPPTPFTVGGPASGYIVPAPSTGGTVTASADEGSLLDTVDVTGQSKFVVVNVLDHFAGGAGFADVDMIHYDSGTVHGVYAASVDYAIRSDTPQIRLFYTTPRARLLYRRGLVATPPLRQRQRRTGIGAAAGPPLRQRGTLGDEHPPLRQRRTL